MKIFARSRLLISSITLLISLDSCSEEEQPPSLDLAEMTSEITFEDADAKDEVSGITGSIVNVTFGEGAQGNNSKGAYFNRSDSAYIDFGDGDAYSFPGNVFTISCWVLVNDTSQPVCILSKRNATGPFEYSVDNHMNKDVFNFDNWVESGATTVYGHDPLNAGVAVKIGEWHHVAFVADGILLKAYSNGVSTGTADTLKQGNFFTDTNAHFQIGVGGGYGKYYFFDGAIDDIRIFKRALSADEIEMLIQL